MIKTSENYNGMVEYLVYLVTRLPEVYCQIWRWKNFENRLAFGKVRGKSRVAAFFLDTVYNCQKVSRKIMQTNPIRPYVVHKNNVQSCTMRMQAHATETCWEQKYEKNYGDSGKCFSWRRQNRSRVSFTHATFIPIVIAACCRFSSSNIATWSSNSSPLSLSMFDHRNTISFPSERT